MNMSLSRNDARIKAMMILYQIFLYDKNHIDYELDDIIKENLEELDHFVLSLVHGVLDHREQLDDMANRYLGSWPIRRLGFTDQSILRVAIYELLYTDTDGKIVINEAIDIGKKYSDEKVVKMINGVLDKVYHEKDEK